MTISIGKPWVLRGLLAALMLFGGELLLWVGPTQTDILEWVLRLIGYGAIATLTLDLAARYRIRDVYGVMLVILTAASLTALLVNPNGALNILPDHIITRTIGAYGAILLEAIGLWLLFTRGDHALYRRRALGFSLPIGIFAAIWARDAHQLAGWTTDTPDLLAVMIGIGIMIGVILAFVISLYRQPKTETEAETPKMMILSQREFAALSVVLVSVGFNRILQDAYGGGEFLVLALVFIAWVVLWFERSDKGRTLLKPHFPLQRVPWQTIIGMIGLFYAGLIFGWLWPSFDFGGYNAMALIEFAFLLLGFLWVPLIVIVTAARALDRQSRKIEVL